MAPPPGPDEWAIFFGARNASKGWNDLCTQAPGPTLAAWQVMRTNPMPSAPTAKHHRLKGDLASANYQGGTLPQWQFEVTGGGRVWYVVDEERRRVILMYAGTQHPKATE